MILRFPGPSVLSGFRRRRLLDKLRALDSGVMGVAAQFVFLVETSRGVTGGEQRELERIIDAAKTSFGDSGRYSCLIVPRFGTISPWSSKATDIVRRCGLSAVVRIERGIEYRIEAEDAFDKSRLDRLKPLLYDRMTETVLGRSQEQAVFQHQSPPPLQRVEVSERGKAALVEANRNLALALSDDELDYLFESFGALQRDPTDAELMMFAQANSEHCRHKIFNATWIVDDELQDLSLFRMIRNTSGKSPSGILSAYKDNAAVVEGPTAAVFLADPETQEYGYREEPVHMLMKVETHNHPTAISPFPGAATGSGGEIRDEAATGRGSRTKAGLTGFSVSNLRIPDLPQPWEHSNGKPARIASALEIMLQAPLGAAAFGNEFGRPNLCGYFRTFEQASANGLRGYHKPIMIAGGLGNIRAVNVVKQSIPPGAPIVVLGGPAMLIGLGGGAASSLDSGASTEDLDFASVQRGNPEMQRRCQEVINHCAALGEGNPILSIHDVGAGGLSNAVPEIIHDAKRGGVFELRDIPSDDPGMSPMQIWCNEAQERYVLALDPEGLQRFADCCARESCPFAVIGHATAEPLLRLNDRLLNDRPVDVPMSLLFGKPPQVQREGLRGRPRFASLRREGIDCLEAARRVLQFPAVSAKSFLIHIGDRSVGGLVARDQLVGPWQVPVADVAVTAASFRSHCGEGMAMGERSPLALIDAPASGRMAVGEALTNIGAARIGALSRVKLSANWMAASGEPAEDFELYQTVKAVGMELCPALGIAIPVGKDSLSMKAAWREDGQDKSMRAPLSLIVTAFAPVEDVRGTLTPQLRNDRGPSRLILIDLGHGRNRLGGSVLAQVYGQIGDIGPDLDDPRLLKAFFDAIQTLNRKNLLLAYHDRSDGGLFTTLCEMALAGHCGLDIDCAPLGEDSLAVLYAEELGAVIQVRDSDLAEVWDRLAEFKLDECSHDIGMPRMDLDLIFRCGREPLIFSSRREIQALWSETSYRMQALRDNPECAKQEYEALLDDSDPGLSSVLGFDSNEDRTCRFHGRQRPRVAVLREQGVNGQVEMAAAFDAAGFRAVDVHMNDILSGRVTLRDFKGLAAGGGFSFGDVLGAGGGWAKSILLNQRSRDEFRGFFERHDTFGLGVCNGCQMLSQLTELIPGASHWPRFLRNDSEQFEARVAMVRVEKSPSVLLAGMEGSLIPVAVAHGEGRAEFRDGGVTAMSEGLISLIYTDRHGRPTEQFPCNPNGSPFGITGVTTADGRFTIMMPHPERCFRTVQNSWHPADWGEYGPWMRLFRNAREWVG